MSLIHVIASIFVMTSVHAADEASSPSPSGSRVFQEKVLKMNRLDDQIKSHEEEFRKLVLKKRHSNDAKENMATISKMKETYAAYEKAMDELGKIKKELKYRFPSEGEEILKNYSHIEKRSPEDLERTVDLGTTLSNAKMAVDEKYKAFMPPQPVKPKTKDAKPESEKPVEQRKIRLER